MADLQIISQLTRKRNEIEARIEEYEREIERCRSDLAAVTATLAMYQSDGIARPAVSVSRLFRRGEIYRLCEGALASAGKPLDTRELAVAIMAVKNLDTTDRVMRKAVARNITWTLSMRVKRGHVKKCPKRNGVTVWALPKMVDDRS